MQASGYARFDCHKREHDAVLRVVARVRPMVEAGDHDVARRLAAEFHSGSACMRPRWTRCSPPGCAKLPRATRLRRLPLPVAAADRPAAEPFQRERRL